ncbi:MAG: ATP-binding protein [Thermoproteota archaeon]
MCKQYYIGITKLPSLLLLAKEMDEEIEKKKIIFYEYEKRSGDINFRYTKVASIKATKKVNSEEKSQEALLELLEKVNALFLNFSVLCLIFAFLTSSSVQVTFLILSAFSFLFSSSLTNLYYDPKLILLNSNPTILYSKGLIKTGYLFLKPANPTNLAGNCKPGISAALANLKLSGGIVVTKQHLLYFVKARSFSLNNLVKNLRSKAAGFSSAYEATYKVRLVAVNAPELFKMLRVVAKDSETSLNEKGYTIRASLLFGRYKINFLPRIPLLNSLRLNEKGLLLISFSPLSGVSGWIKTSLAKFLFSNEVKKLLSKEGFSERNYFSIAQRVLSYDILFNLSLVVLTFSEDEALHQENVESTEASIGIEDEQRSYDEESKEFLKGFKVATPRFVKLKNINPVSAIRKFFSSEGILIPPLDLEYLVYPLPHLKSYLAIPKPLATAGDIEIGSTVDETLRDSYPYFLSSEDLHGNVLIIGTTGSGKSVTAATIVKNLRESVLIFDWNGEYSRALGPLGFNIYEIGEYSYNPFERAGVSKEEVPLRLAELTNSLIAYAYHQPLTPTQYSLLIEALKEMENYSIRILVKKIKQKIEREKRADLLRAWESLYAKLLPVDQNYFIPSGNTIHCDQIINQRSIIDMHLMNEHSKLFLVLSILENLYLMATRGKLFERLVVVVDEAHRLQFKTNKEIGAEKPTVGIPPPVVERITRECRKYGLNMILITQVPSGVTEEVQANLGVVVCHRTKGKEAEVASSIIGLSSRFGEASVVGLLNLPTGYAYIETTRTPLQLVHVASKERELISRMEVKTLVL